MRFREFYSDEMHIQFDWDLSAHIGTREIRTRYLTPSFAKDLAPVLPRELRDADRMLVYHGFHQENGAWTRLQHVLGPEPGDIEKTFWMRKRYFERLQEQVVGLCLDGLRHAEKLYGFVPSTRAHATWQESPTCDLFSSAGVFQASTARGISTYDFSPEYVGSSSIREAISGCYDYFAWNDFFTAGGNDFCECGLLDRDYYGGAMAASFAALNRYPTSYWGCWGFPGSVGARVWPVFEAYGAGQPPHAWVQGLMFREAAVAILQPLAASR